MFTDARSFSSGSFLDADVCIVGAGVAGVTMAREFVGRPEKVVLLEGGGLEFTRSLRRLPTILQRHTRGEQSLARGRLAGLPYYPLRFTRARAFGGSSRAWHHGRGVHAHPLDAIDFEARDGLPHHGWPFDRAHLDPYYERAQDVLALGPFAYDPEAWEARGFGGALKLDPELVRTEVFQFGEDSRLDRFASQLDDAENVTVALHGVAVNVAGAGTRVHRLDCATLSGVRFAVRARVYVIATGAIEAARLMLVSTDDRATGIGNEHDLVGRYFMEHPDLAVGLLVPTPGLDEERLWLYERQQASETLGIQAMLRLTDATLRTERLLNSVLRLRPTYLTEAAQGVRSAQVVRRSVHHGIRMRGLSRHVLRTLREPRPLLRHYRSSRSGRPADAFAIDVMAEQAPDAASRVRLARRRDQLGMPLTVLDWRLTDQDLDSIRRTLEILGESLSAAGLGSVTSIIGADGLPPAIFGNWHQLGTTRMHRDPARGVVDEHCRVHSMENLYVVGGSVFPTGGYANPALTITALALRLADHLRSTGPDAEDR